MQTASAPLSCLPFLLVAGEVLCGCEIHEGCTVINDVSASGHQHICVYRACVRQHTHTVRTHTRLHVLTHTHTHTRTHTHTHTHTPASPRRWTELPNANSMLYLHSLNTHISSLYAAVLVWMPSARLTCLSSLSSSPP